MEKEKGSEARERERDRERIMAMCVAILLSSRADTLQNSCVNPVKQHSGAYSIENPAILRVVWHVVV